MSQLISQLLATSPWEAIAAGLGLIYLLLAVRRNLWCWLCAFISSAIYLALFAQQGIYMQAALQVVYLLMAIYGFLHWQHGRSSGGDGPIRSFSLAQHLIAAVAVLAATSLNGWLLGRDMDAASPYLDAFVAWGSIVTTWMVARRIIENWLYWIVVDGAGVWLFYSQGLLATALLFAVYLGIVVQGYLVWRRDQAKQRASVAADAAEHVAG